MHAAVSKTDSDLCRCQSHLVHHSGNLLPHVGVICGSGAKLVERYRYKKSKLIKMYVGAKSVHREWTDLLDYYLMPKYTHRCLFDRGSCPPTVRVIV